jgi:hypothetical protein
MSEINPKNISTLDWLTIQECAEACKYKGPEGIVKAIKKKELRAFRFERRKLLVLKEDLVKWILSKQTVKPSLKEQLASAANKPK